VESLSVLTAIIQVDLAGTGMSPFWILLELRMMEVVVITGAMTRAELQSQAIDTSKPTPSFLQAGYALPVTQPTASEH